MCHVLLVLMQYFFSHRGCARSCCCGTQESKKAYKNAEKGKKKRKTNDLKNTFEKKHPYPDPKEIQNKKKVADFVATADGDVMKWNEVFES